MTDEHLLEKCNYDNRTALHLAVVEGHYDLAAFIVEKIDKDKINEEDRYDLCLYVFLALVFIERIVKLKLKRFSFFSIYFSFFHNS